MKEFENMTGNQPSIVGLSWFGGTKSARVGLTVLHRDHAPDPKNSGPIGAALPLELKRVPWCLTTTLSDQSEVSDMMTTYQTSLVGSLTTFPCLSFA
jgi:hypothetical protein